MTSTKANSNFSESNIDPDVLLQAQGVFFGYEGFPEVLSDINLRIRRGLFTMVLGRSGSGKTTLIKVLAGILKPTRGSVELFQPVFPCSRQIAYIPQNLGLIRNLSALDNVLIGALGLTSTFSSIFRRFDKQIVVEANRILRELGIASKANRKIWHLSGGERQRVAIARALIRNPQVILADEFVSQLDPVTSMEILTIMKSLSHQKIAFLITTHDLALAQEYADRVIVMRNGQISREQAASEITSDEIIKEIK